MFIFIGFAVAAVYAYGSSQKHIDEAANLPFADEDKSETSEEDKR